MEAKNSTKNVTIEATIKRADGTIEPLGIVSKGEPDSSLINFMKKIGGIK